MRMRPAPLEDWLRDYYFTATLDLGSSGVAPFSFGQLRELLELDPGELDRVVFGDSESLGDPALRARIAARWAGDRPERVMVTHGSTEAIFLAMTGLLEAGDEVVAVEPGYHALSAVAEAIGCRLRWWRLRPEAGFAPDLAELAELVTDRTRMLVVNFPHNPTGVSLTVPQLHELVEIAGRHGSYLLWDAAFQDLTYGTDPLPDPASWYDRGVSVGTLSKVYGLPGLRVGWCIADPAVFDGWLPVRDRLTLCLSPMVELVARRVIERAGTLAGQRLPQARRNRDRLLEWAARNRDVVDLVAPAGGVTGFPRLRVPDVDRLCRRLGERDRVLLVPGSAFGHPDRVRLGFGGPAGEFETGLNVVEKALREPDA